MRNADRIAFNPLQTSRLNNRVQGRCVGWCLGSWSCDWGESRCSSDWCRRSGLNRGNSHRSDFRNNRRSDNLCHDRCRLGRRLHRSDIGWCYLSRRNLSRSN